VKIARILGIVVIALVVIVIAIPFFIDVNRFRPELESQLTSALGRQTSVGNLKLSLWSGTVEADDLSIADDPAFSKSPFLQAKSLGVGVEILPLITSRQVNVTAITIDQPQISLLQTPAGNWNYATLGAKSTPAANTSTSSAPSSSTNLDLSVKLVKISNGRLTIAKTSGHSKPTILDKVNIELKDFARASVMPFSLSAALNGGGELKLDGKAGPIQENNLEATPMNATLKITHLDLVASGVMDPASGIAGLASIDGSAESDGKQFSAKGKVKAEQVKLVKGGSPAGRPLEFDFALRHNLATRAGSLNQGDVHVGKAQASLTGTYAPHGESVAIKANLVGDQMALQELEAMLPALNIVLPAGSKLEGGTALAKLNVEGPLDNLVSSGTVGLNNVKLAGFNLGQKMSVIESLAGIKSSPTTEIQVMSGNVRNSSEGTTIEDLKLVATDIGELTGSGSVSPAKALDFKMRVSLKTGMIPAALGARTQSGIPFFIRGTAQDPKFEPDIKGMAAGEIKDLKGSAVKAAGGLLDNLLNKKKN
jgi:AsmA protein